jgi:hypothetical protein
MIDPAPEPPAPESCAALPATRAEEVARQSDHLEVEEKRRLAEAASREEDA